MRMWALLVACAGGIGCAEAPPAPPPSPLPPTRQAGFRVPTDAEIPSDQVGVSVRRGRALLADTRDSLPGLVGNALRCTSCHLANGTQADAAPWVGVYSRFPQYRSRNAKVNLIEDRISDCFKRSLYGTPPALGSREMTDIIAYMAFLSRGVPPPGDVSGQGFRTIPPLPTDTARGKLVYVGQCARCHGARGEGMYNPDRAGSPAYYPPLWGDRSYSIGAGMARLRTAASFIRFNMPFDRPGTLTDQESYDVAAYVVSRPRPDFAPKALDWPKGDPPPDVAYPTNASPKRTSP